MSGPPQPPRRPVRLVAHGDVRVDDWFWLRDRNDPAVRAHLEAENDFTDAELARLEPLREKLFDELATRIELTDESAPVPDGPFEYFTRTEEGRQYVVHCRRPRGGGTTVALLDENAEAAGTAFFAVGDFAVSPDHRLAAYTVDVTGDERMTLRFRDLGSGADLDDTVPDVYYGLAWNDTASSVLYVRPDAANRPFQVWRHRVGTDPRDDALVFTETDDHFFVHVRRARCGGFLLIETASKIASETWLVRADRDDVAPLLVEARQDGVEYSVEPHRASDGTERVYIVTNADGAFDFSLVVAPAATPGRAAWSELLAHVPGTRLRSVGAFADFLVLSERAEARERLRVLDLVDGRLQEIPVEETVASTWLGENREYATRRVRYGYSSLVVPTSDCDHDLDTGRSTLVKRQVVHGHRPEEYRSERLWATAPDGVQVPISLVSRRDVERDGTAPLVLGGYGAYEASYDPTFRSSRVSLLDRGVVVAIAHVRGGGELGRRWYEGGRLASKSNTFTDFVAVAEHLVAEAYTGEGRIVARGRSAGGLLMGVVTNLAPTLFAGVVAEVPFVDVLSTMSDASLPLTVTEWDEWGDPADPAAYAAMRAYSPYDNVSALPYPRVLATAGFHDSRVQYWEPAKWVARLRSQSTSGAPVLLRTELRAGHGGPSGRYDAWRDEAFVLAFVLDALGITT